MVNNRNPWPMSRPRGSVWRDMRKSRKPSPSTELGSPHPAHVVQLLCDTVAGSTQVSG
ncbi:predicted protein [Plenodomus lingam JN3]|uniref:Predicted protein n=1 Tax=Leptosphaeria maculans (strain JN3 / isolate v23.1.3 / race Av1-4-5-6-7-8) TaxID=985895 RepID=E4ZMZ2_LEPMJ|nr:predicted protein [Plenodomus lingam JN3]CBX92595.1 predicted protein [Plenodomus lingam JN3]